MLRSLHMKLVMIMVLLILSLMMVVGSNAGGRTHPDWKQNMALAAKLHAQLEKRFPGICRPISFRTERFNQDLSPGALLIEVGAAEAKLIRPDADVRLHH